MKIIQLYRDGSEVFVNLETVSRMSFTKSDKLRQSDREVKIIYTDGSNGTYVGHRNLAKSLAALSSNTQKTIAETVLDSSTPNVEVTVTEEAGE